MIIRRRIPCHDGAGRLPDHPGTYHRTCPVCRTRWTVEVAVSPVITRKCGGARILAADWVQEQPTKEKA